MRASHRGESAAKESNSSKLKNVKGSVIYLPEPYRKDIEEIRLDQNWVDTNFLGNSS